MKKIIKYWLHGGDSYEKQKKMAFVVVCWISTMADGFLENVIAGAEIEFSVFMKLLAAVLFFMAGIAGHYRYNKSTGK